MRKILLLLLSALFTVSMSYAQDNNVKITGKLLDAQTKEPLIGATVGIKGTSKGTSVALDGSFKIQATADGSTTLVFSYIGYISKELTVTAAELGTITLDPTSASISEVKITAANPSKKIDRQTPVAASSINQIYIEEKGAGAEFPELMKMTPGTTFSRGEGGYGDSRINIRGFASNNVALLINGIPLNDPEAGKIYWNDWAGLEDVTTSMQIQRGLSASKVATPAVGGTIDITTRNTETEEGGTIAQSIGSYGEEKTLISYATGLNAKGWATSFLLSRSTGNSPSSEGLYYTGYNYFANISKVIGNNQVLSFNFMGASQRHGQFYTPTALSVFQNAPQGTHYNSDWGYLNGQEYSAEQNFYNKPLASINYNWNINATTSWSTILYGSWGTGAADYLATQNSSIHASLTPGSSTAIPRTGGIYSPIDFDAITKNNTSTVDGSANYYMQDVENNHQQYGALSSIHKKVGNITYLGGLDLRYYEGEHFQKVDDLFGASYVNDPYTAATPTAPHGNINNPANHATTGQKFNDDYTYFQATEGIYAQAEYSKDALTAFVTISGSNTSDRKLDYFHYLTSDPNRETKWVNFLGYQIKGGANYNIDEHNNIYANLGYIQRPPLIGGVFSNVNLNTINTQAIDEKLFDYELGYGYKSAQFTADVNGYRTSYNDRTQIFTDPQKQGDYINVSGLNEMHEGVEAEAKYRPVQGVILGGMLSIGNYYYTSNTKGVTETTTNTSTGATTPVTTGALPLKGVKIGDPGSSVTGAASATSAQTTAGASLDVKVLSNVTIGADYLYYGRYYAAYNPSKITAPGYMPYEVPDFSTLDLNIVFRFKFAGLNAEFIGNVYNVLNNKYISEAYESNPASATTVAQRIQNITVDMGPQRYYMTTFKIKF